MHQLLKIFCATEISLLDDWTPTVEQTPKKRVSMPYIYMGVL